MDPKEWGAPTWTFLHVLTFKSQASYNTLKTFFMNVQYLLPCSVCRNNYQEHLKILPFPATKKELVSWLIQFHNRVNQTREKEEDMIGYWRQRIKRMTHTRDIGIWTFIQCSIHTHPGKYKASPELLNAHRFIWEHLDELLPNFLEDYVGIIEYIRQHPMNEIALKKIYHENAHKLFNKFNLIDSHIKEHRLCKKYCKIGANV